MKPLCAAAQMRAWDDWTINSFGLAGLVLMEHAGKGLAEIIREKFNPVSGLNVALVCGRGNNGGDGLVIGRWLARWGARVHFWLLAEPGQVAGDALANLRLVQGLGLPLATVLGPADLTRLQAGLDSAGLVVDALLGTGLNQPVKGLYREVIGLINAAAGVKVAVDLPSGLNADTGQVLDAAVKAGLTGTFGALKIGQAIHPGLDYCGELKVVDIGLPAQAPAWAEVNHFLLEPSDLARLWPRLPAEAHKGAAGHLLLLAGSPGKTGAAGLAAQAALRAGAGLVTVGCPAGVQPVVAGQLTEAMTAPLAQTSEGFLGRAAIEALGPLLQGKSALAVGPGLGTDPETAEVLGWLLERVPLPVVLDADALNLLARRPELLNWAAEGAVLTPHPGEAARLLGCSAAEVQADRLGAVKRLAGQTGQVVALKGARTLVAAPDGRVYVNPTGNQGLAQGGSGDVLTGLIGALLAQGLSPLQAAQAGVLAHGLAADRLWAEWSGRGFLASEVAAALPRTVNDVLAGGGPGGH